MDTYRAIPEQELLPKAIHEFDNGRLQPIAMALVFRYYT